MSGVHTEQLWSSLFAACDGWYGVAHGCTRKLGMKICGEFIYFIPDSDLLHKSLAFSHCEGVQTLLSFYPLGQPSDLTHSVSQCFTFFLYSLCTVLVFMPQITDEKSRAVIACSHRPEGSIPNDCPIASYKLTTYRFNRIKVFFISYIKW